MSEPFNLAQLTKEMVVHQLKNLEDPARIVAEVVRGTLVARQKGPAASLADVQTTVRDVCRGAVAGMLVVKCPLPRGCAKVLLAARSFAKSVGLDRDAINLAAIKGLADVRRFVDTKTVEEIKVALEGTRTGTGTEFLHFCGNPAPYQSHPGYVPPKV